MGVHETRDRCVIEHDAWVARALTARERDGAARRSASSEQRTDTGRERSLDAHIAERSTPASLVDAQREHGDARASGAGSERVAHGGAHLLSERRVNVHQRVPPEQPRREGRAERESVCGSQPRAPMTSAWRKHALLEAAREGVLELAMLLLAERPTDGRARAVVGHRQRRQ